MSSTIDRDVRVQPEDQETHRSAPPWRLLVRWALVGTMAMVLVVIVDVHRGGNGNLVSLAQPGMNGSASALFTQDFPELEQPEADGLDGQIYYAIARDPIHLDQTSRYLDHPRYRLQRPLLPWLAWAGNLGGGGVSLVLAMAAVTLIGLFVGCLATGVLSTWLGGPAWAGMLFALTPGAYWSLRVSVSDSLALALAAAAIAMATRHRYGPAVVVGILAVLAKEPVILVLIGWALARRTKRDTLLAVVPAVAAGPWMLWLRITLPPDRPRSQDIDVPLRGLWEGWTQVWSQGNELVGMACTFAGLALGVVALWRRGLGHPLGWIIAIQLAFMSVMGVNPTSTNFGGTRMAMPAMVFAVLALLTPRGSTVREVAAVADGGR